MDCWAISTKSCSGKQSKEHYVSGGFFGDRKVTVYGLSWCNDEPMEIGLSNAVAKILCESHNHALAPYDGAASKLSAFLTRSIQDEPLKEHSVEIKGADFEKWAMKTLFNLGYIGALDQKNFVRLIPPDKLVSYIFKNAKVGDGAGLYFVPAPIKSSDYANALSWKAIQNFSHANKVAGMAFTFNGLNFVVNIHPFRAEKQIKNLSIYADLNLSESDIIYHPPNIVFQSNSAGSKKINFIW